jgi:hypothetical protein
MVLSRRQTRAPWRVSPSTWTRKHSSAVITLSAWLASRPRVRQITCTVGSTQSSRSSVRQSRICTGAVFWRRQSCWT